MTGIFIDDSGSPGIKSKSKYDTIDRKTWLALMLTKSQREEANFQMIECVAELRKTYSAKEFHFTDIYSGTMKFKKVPLNARLNLFWMFANIFRSYKYPMLLQTFTSDDILRNKFVVTGKSVKFDNFDLKDTSDFALLFLLVRIKKHLIANPSLTLPVEIIIDEGRQKKNSSQDSGLLKDYAFNQKLQYKSSEDEPLLQLVDFVAFSVNKIRWILTNDKRGDIDLQMLKIFEWADFNILNIVKEQININEYTVNDYDKMLRNVYDKNGNLEDMQLEKLKGILEKK